GKLATDGCQQVEVVGEDGQLERRSMVYTEYFAPGTAPTAYCDLHPTRGIFSKIAGLLGGDDDHPPPPRVADVVPPAAAATAQTVVGSSGEAAAPPPEKKKKRGFWSKLFGVGRDDP